MIKSTAYLFIISCLTLGCLTHKNIIIHDEQLTDLIMDFTEKVNSHTGVYPEFISVVSDKSEQSHVWGLYDSKYLKSEFYIGYAILNDIKIYFYSISELGLNEFIRVNKKDVKSPDPSGRIHKYVRHYTYEDGQFFLHKVK